MLKKVLIAAAMSAFLSGCETITVDQIQADNRQQLVMLSAGMSKQEVLDTMGTKKIKAIDGTVVTNPYRTEMYRTKDGAIELLLYYTDRKQFDGAITDDELTPIVLKDGKVDGWGWSYWEDLIKKYEIRVR